MFFKKEDDVFNIEYDVQITYRKYNQYKVKKAICNLRSEENNLLPTTREVADYLNISRQAVWNHYQKLISQGWIKLYGDKFSFQKRFYWLMTFEESQVWLMYALNYEQQLINEKKKYKLDMKQFRADKKQALKDKRDYLLSFKKSS